MNSIFSSYYGYHPFFSNSSLNNSPVVPVEETAPSIIATTNPQRSPTIGIPAVLINNILKFLSFNDKTSTSIVSYTFNHLTKNHFLSEVNSLQKLGEKLLDTLSKNFYSTLKNIIDEIHSLKNKGRLEDLPEIDDIHNQLVDLLTKSDIIYRQFSDFAELDQNSKILMINDLKNILKNVKSSLSELIEKADKIDDSLSETIKNDIYAQIDFTLGEQLEAVFSFIKECSSVKSASNPKSLLCINNSKGFSKCLEEVVYDAFKKLDERTRNAFFKMLPASFSHIANMIEAEIKILNAKDMPHLTRSKEIRDACFILLKFGELEKAIAFADTIPIDNIRSSTLLRIATHLLTINYSEKALEIAKNCRSSCKNTALDFCKKLVDRNLSISAVMNTIEATQAHDHDKAYIIKNLILYIIGKNDPKATSSIIKIITTCDYKYRQFLIDFLKTTYIKKGDTNALWQILEASLFSKSDLFASLHDSFINEIIDRNKGTLEWFCDTAISMGYIKSVFYASQKIQDTSHRLEIVTRIVHFYRKEGNFKAAINIVREASINDFEKRGLFIMIFETLKRDQNYQKNDTFLKKLSEIFNSLNDTEMAFNAAKLICDNVSRKLALLNIFDTLVNQKNLNVILRYITLLENSSDKEYILGHVAKKIDRRLIDTNQLLSIVHESESMLEIVFAFLAKINNLKIAVIIADESNFVREKVKRFMALSKILIQNGKSDQLFEIINSLTNNRDKIMIFQSLSRYLFGIQNYWLYEIAIDSISDDYDQGLAIITIAKDLLESNLEKAQTLIERIKHAGLQESARSLINRYSSQAGRN